MRGIFERFLRRAAGAVFLVRIRCNDRVVNRVWVDAFASARRVAWQIQNRLAWDGLVTEAWILEVPEPQAGALAEPPLPPGV